MIVLRSEPGNPRELFNPSLLLLSSLLEVPCAYELALEYMSYSLALRIKAYHTTLIW